MNPNFFIYFRKSISLLSKTVIVVQVFIRTFEGKVSKIKIWIHFGQSLNFPIFPSPTLLREYPWGFALLYLFWPRVSFKYCIEILIGPRSCTKKHSQFWKSHTKKILGDKSREFLKVAIRATPWKFSTTAVYLFLCVKHWGSLLN